MAHSLKFRSPSSVKVELLRQQEHEAAGQVPLQSGGGEQWRSAVRSLSLLIQLTLQLVGWCCPHPGWLSSPLLTESRKSLTDLLGALFPCVISEPVGLTHSSNHQTGSRHAHQRAGRSSHSTEPFRQTQRGKFGPEHFGLVVMTHVFGCTFFLLGETKSLRGDFCALSMRQSCC